MSYEEQIDNIMDWFDFDKVHKAMVALNWTWYNVGIPEKAELRQTARRLLRDVVEKDARMTGTGGFYATKNEYGELSLYFAVSKWDCEIEEEEPNS